MHDAHEEGHEAQDDDWNRYGGYSLPLTSHGHWGLAEGSLRRHAYPSRRPAPHVLRIEPTGDQR